MPNEAKPDFSRSTALLGEEGLANLSKAHVAVIGVGGVGSWCAEALVRSGLGAITLVDDDLVAASNVNRQCPALVRTIGARKVEAMRERLLEINPDCRVTAVFARYPFEGERPFKLRDFTLIVDAIDSVAAKAELILEATEAGVPILSSMGAALRLDPTRVRVKRFEKVEGDGLARALRQRFKRLGRYPSAQFICVCSEEPPLRLEDPDVKGSLMPVTSAFGMALASEALRRILSQSWGWTSR